MTRARYSSTRPESSLVTTSPLTRLPCSSRRVARTSPEPISSLKHPEGAAMPPPPCVVQGPSALRERDRYRIGDAASSSTRATRGTWTTSTAAGRGITTARRMLVATDRRSAAQRTFRWTRRRGSGDLASRQRRFSFCRRGHTVLATPFSTFPFPSIGGVPIRAGVALRRRRGGTHR
jgi:hypothetical protein